MKNLLLIAFLLFCCSCVEEKIAFKINYNYEKDSFVLRSFYNFDNCKYIILKKDNQIISISKFANDKHISIIIPKKFINTGVNSFFIECNNKIYQASFIVNKYDLLNRLIYSKDFEEFNDLNCHEYSDIISKNDFVSEYRYFINALKEEDSKKMFVLLKCMNIDDQIKLIDNFLELYDYDWIVDYIFVNQYKFNTHPSFENLINKLLQSRNEDYQNKTIEIILNYPVKRYYEAFFNSIYSKKIHHGQLLDFLNKNSSTEFSKSVFEFMKKKIILGEIDQFVFNVFKIYAEKGEDRFLFLTNLLDNYKKEDFNFIKDLLNNVNLNHEQGELIFKLLDKISDSELRIIIYEKLLLLFKNNPDFYKKLIEINDEKLNSRLLNNINQLSFRYDYIYFVEFYKKMLEREDNIEILNYFLNAPKEISKMGLKLYYMKNSKSISILAKIKEIDPDYFLNEIKTCAKNPNCQNYEWSVMELSQYKNEYYDELINIYNNENRRNLKIKILKAIARTGEIGANFAYKQLLNNEDLKDSILLREIAFNGDLNLSKKILEGIFHFSKEQIMNVLEGFRDSKKQIDCEILQKLYNNKIDKDIRINILWTWAWCCPDSYVEFLKSNKYTFDSDLHFDAIDAVEDIIENVKSEMKKNVVPILTELYNLRKTKEIRRRIIQILNKYKIKDAIPFLEILKKDCEEYKEYDLKIELDLLEKKLIIDM